jgi:hypothetical protein
MKKNKKSKTMFDKPSYVSQLEKAYGAPSQNGFGSAVFFEMIGEIEDLEKASLEKYKYFVGETWDRFGEDAWMSVWKEVYKRQPDADHDIVNELQAIRDRDIQQSVPMILEVVEKAEEAKLALSKTYDDEQVVELRVFNLGDGDMMSGLLIVGQRSNDETTFLVFLMD